MVYKYQGQYYDITGIYEDIAFSFIPVEKMGDCLLDFKHIPGNHYNASEQELAKFNGNGKNDTTTKGNNQTWNIQTKTQHQTFNYQ